MQRRFKLDQLAHFAFHQSGHRNSGPFRHDLGDVFGIDFLLEHARLVLQLVEVASGFLDTTFKLGNPAISDLGCNVEISLTFDLRSKMFHLLLQISNGVDCLLLSLPMRLHDVRFCVELGELLMQCVKPIK